MALGCSDAKWLLAMTTYFEFPSGPVTLLPFGTLSIAKDCPSGPAARSTLPSTRRSTVKPRWAAHAAITLRPMNWLGTGLCVFRWPATVCSKIGQWLRVEFEEREQHQPARPRHPSQLLQVDEALLVQQVGEHREHARDVHRGVRQRDRQLAVQDKAVVAGRPGGGVIQQRLHDVDADVFDLDAAGPKRRRQAAAAASHVEHGHAGPQSGVSQDSQLDLSEYVVEAADGDIASSTGYCASKVATCLS